MTMKRRLLPADNTQQHEMLHYRGAHGQWLCFHAHVRDKA